MKVTTIIMRKGKTARDKANGCHGRNITNRALCAFRSSGLKKCDSGCPNHGK